MDEIYTALKNPGWWVLTVLVGLVLNVVAPFANRQIDRVWKARAERRKEHLDLMKAVEKKMVDRLKSRPTGALEAKVDAMYWAVRVVLVLAVYLMLIQLCFAVPYLPGQFVAAPLSIIAFLAVTRHWRKWKHRIKIHNEVVRQTSDEASEDAD